MKGLKRFQQHLNDLFEREPKIFVNKSNNLELDDVHSIVYENTPEEGYVTGLTYGLSLINKKEWEFGRPELCICVESQNIEWGDVIGYIANDLREKSQFRYGQIINFGEKVSDDSEMSAFLIAAPNIFEKEDCFNIDIGLEYKINIAQLYPIYQEEIEVYNKIGYEKFISHPNFDAYNLKRKVITP